jgi:hypothetical protein
MTHGTDCTAATFTRVVWVRVRDGGLVVGYLVTPGPGQPPALTPARQPLMGNSLTPSLQELARRKKKSGVSEDFSTFKKVLQRTAKFKKTLPGNQNVSLYVMLLSARLRNLTGSIGRMFFCLTS